MATRENRFDDKQCPDRLEYETLKDKRANKKKELEDAKAAKRPKNLLQADYKTRGLDFCYYCGDKFNVGEKIPRVLIHCGHTFCTQCLSALHHNYRVRCPICRKLVKQVECVDKLPLNFNILYEIVERDYILRDINFEDEDCIESLLCEKHDQRVQHFYCSNHLTVFCRECIKEDHTDERCFVVDLYEIEKMRKMHRLNQQMNQKQLEKRKDDADQSCVTQEIPVSQIQGDSKWFKKRKENLLLQQQEKQKKQLQMLQNQQKLLAQQAAKLRTGAPQGIPQQNIPHSQMDQSQFLAMGQAMFQGHNLSIDQQKELFKALQSQKAGGGQQVPMELFQMLMNSQNPMQQQLIVDQYGSEKDENDEDDDSDEEIEHDEGEIEFNQIQTRKQKPKTKKKFASDDDCEGISDSDGEDDDLEDSDPEEDSEGQVYMDEDDQSLEEKDINPKAPLGQPVSQTHKAGKPAPKHLETDSKSIEVQQDANSFEDDEEDQNSTGNI